MYTLVVDCMGSDGGSKVTVAGIKLFLTKHSNVKIIAVGKKEELEELQSENNVEIVDARDVVPMESGALEVMRMRKSSMMIALDLMKENGYDGVVSAGSTGGFLSAATVKLKLVEGVDRAALISPFPTAIKGKKVVVLDIGASNENTPEQLVQFAKMGRIYSNKVMKVEKPKIYLLSNGAEDEKGSPEVKEAHKMLKEMNFEGFVGNIEGRDALNGDCDVIVTGGFAGNVFLKSVEGVASMMKGMIKKAFYRNLKSKIGYVLAKKGFDEMSETMDYKSTGGAMLLGVNGVVVKAHGSSDGYSFSCALDVAYRMVEGKVVELLKQGVGEIE